MKSCCCNLFLLALLQLLIIVLLCHCCCCCEAFVSVSVIVSRSNNANANNNNDVGIFSTAAAARYRHRPPNKRIIFLSLAIGDGGKKDDDTEDTQLDTTNSNRDEPELSPLAAASGSATTSSSSSSSSSSSKRNMLKFAIPALGIYLSNPLLSNIDNAFVGRAVGTSGLAALSPATLCTDQMLYLFGFLARATTGLVSRAYAKKQPQTTNVEVSTDSNNAIGNTKAAREAASAPLTVSLVCGMGLTIMYAFLTPNLLSMFKVRPELRSQATSYIYFRGSVAWAALCQSTCLSIMMATRDAITPLKIIAIASLVNVIGDAAFCVWPLQMGCAGAAAATAIATIFSSGIMVKALQKKQLLPKIRIPTRQELNGLLEFTGPLLAITITRLAGFLVMQRAAMNLGIKPLAAYQLCINLLLFFLLFGEPLSQLSQTQLPALLDNDDGNAVRANLKGVLTLATGTALAVGGVSYAAIQFGSRLFTSDIAVQQLAQQSSLQIFAAVATAVFTVAVDGSMLASKDFTFMLMCGGATFVMQIFYLFYLPHKYNIGFIFNTFTYRLGIYAVLALLRAGLGHGPLGKDLRKGKKKGRMELQ